MVPVAAGGRVRTTRDRKRATTDVGTGLVSAERRWRETSWEVAAHYELVDRMAAYATMQSGYQTGQFPARPYCLFVDPDCFTAGDNITALNYEIGVKGQPVDGLELSEAVFRTRYDDLPYQVSTTTGAGFRLSASGSVTRPPMCEEGSAAGIVEPTVPRRMVLSSTRRRAR